MRWLTRNVHIARGVLPYPITANAGAALANRHWPLFLMSLVALLLSITCWRHQA